MKSIALRVIFLFLMIKVTLVSDVSAQTSVYHSWPKSNSSAFWRTNWSDAGICMSMSAAYQYYYSGDTIINSTNYIKVWKSGGLLGGCYWGTPFGYQGGIREDSVSRKIYIVLPTDSTERLLYDFTLQIGDTVHTIQDSIFWLTNLVVVQIDSILVGATYRKMWTFSSTITDPYNIVEGIGSMGGLIDPLGVFENGGTLVCYKDSSTRFDSPWGWDPWYQCDTMFQNVDESLYNSVFVLYPNPANDQLIVSTTAAETIEITDAIGRVVFSGTSTGNNTTIDVSGFAPGMYFVNVYSGGAKTTERLIVE